MRGTRAWIWIVAALVCYGAGYGTRSSTLLRLGEPGTRSEWRFADGPPCETDYEDRSFLLREPGFFARS